MQPYSFFPASYINPYQMQTTQITTQQNQSSFIRVPNEMTAREYPVAPGNSVTFIDESAPYCYTKTAGNSPLEAPIFKRYKLVEEIQPQTVQNAAQGAQDNKGIDLSEYALKADTAALNVAYNELKAEIDKLKATLSASRTKSILETEYEGIDE